METKFTPGPWRVGFGGQEGDGYAVIVSPFSEYPICNVEPLGYTRENAQLISAAPELAEACRAMLYMVEQCGYGGSNQTAERAHISAARAALAKAELASE